jgi:hypothetical protein
VCGGYGVREIEGIEEGGVAVQKDYSQNPRFEG